MFVLSVLHAMPTGTITALQAQAQDAQRINIFIDNAFALGISLSTLARERLFVGQVLSNEDYERLARTEHADKAVRVAMRLLEARLRSTAEIRERLQRKEFDQEAIELALARLAELGLVDDEAFARRWVENRQLYRPRGPGALRNELRRKGINAALIERALSDEELIGDTEAQALEAARRVLRKYTDASDYASFSRRLGGYLLRRGFTSDTIRPILVRLWRESRSDEPDELAEQ